ncbi:MAG: lipoyl(octanoyl) transferase LipB [Rickettsiales bacterium]|nr:lipoyl(octanoyl) transferase LipB [Rickettsiales bacterium]
MIKTSHNPFINDYLEKIEWNFEKKYINFSDALELMQRRVDEIINQDKPPLIWVLEHEAVYTAGVSAKNEDAININDNIPVFKTNRGGKYTFHGPKMKIIYVLLDLKKLFYPKNPDISIFIKFLENWIINILADFKIKGEVRNDRVGIWVNCNNKEEKISAIGIKLKKWVSYHGIAVNIDPDLLFFNNIIPCGIKNYGVTSIAKIYQQKLQEFDYQSIEQLIFLKIKEHFIKSYQEIINQ